MKHKKMKNNNYYIEELNETEMKSIQGGLIFLLLIPLAINTINAVIIGAPVVASFSKGWKDYSN